ncbi:MAG: SCP2 sterol-binding domain-containing protein [Gemmatimonadales bacterium]
MPNAFSDEWARAWGDALNASPEYAAAAATWEGSVAAAVVAEPGDPPLAAVFLDVWHGQCRTARAAAPADLEEATYVIEAAPASWREVFSGRLAPLMGLMSGKLRIARGDLATLVPYAGAARELVRIAGTVPTDYPADW